MILTKDELIELNEAFADAINYASDDPTDPIDPLVYRSPDGETCLHIAALRNNHRAAVLLLKSEIDVDSQGDMGRTPLHHAFRLGNQEIVRVLLEHGASKHIVNEFGIQAMATKTQV